MNESNHQSQTPRIDYDGQWKHIVEVFFEPMMKFVMPDLASDIDFSKPPEFLQQELAKIMPEQTAKGRMSTDKLFKVTMKNGEYEHIFLHVEVESQRKLDFPEKNFKYFYRIFDRKGKAITALVIYASDDVPIPHDRYVYDFRGTRLVYEFNTYLVRDADEEMLLKSDNIFALVILTCKYINQTKNDFDLRRKFKMKLFRLAIERGYPNAYIMQLLTFIGILMYLPPEIEKGFKMSAEKEFKTTTLDVNKQGLDYLANLFGILEGKRGEEFMAKAKADAMAEAMAEAKVEVRAEVVEEVRAEVVEEVRAEVVEEQRKAKINIIRNLILSTSMQPDEIAGIVGISIEEVLKIKAEIDAEN